MRIVLTGGKTGGHVFPALAVAESLRQFQPGSRSSRSGAATGGAGGAGGAGGSGSRAMAEFLYIGFAGGIEEQVVPAAGIPLVSLPLASPDSIANRLRFLIGGLRALRASVARLRSFHADVVFSTGGFVSLPVTTAAWILRRPIVIFLPDATPGKTVRLTRRWARAIATTTTAAANQLGGARTVVTGYPVRAEFVGISRRDARESLGLGDSDLLLLVVGGSQGARFINQVIVASLPRILPVARILHVCGPGHLDEVLAARNQLPAELRHRYRVEGYLAAREMACAMFAGDLAVTRAGASILGELPAAALPAIVIPLPINAQDANAATLEAAGASVVLPQPRAHHELAGLVLSLLDSPEARQRMRSALKDLQRPSAADDIAGLIMDVGGCAA